MEALPLGGRLKAARLERKLTQDELARDTFSKSYVSAVELGKIHPSIKALRVLARRLQLPASYFLETLEPDIETQQAQLALARARLLVTMSGRNQEPQALEILSKLDFERLNEYEAAEATFLEGRALVALERTDEGLLKLQQAQVQWEELENFTWVERVRNLIGEIYHKQHKFSMAQEHHKLCLEAIQKGIIRDPNLKLSIYANLARGYTAFDMHDAARNLFEDANATAQSAATPETLVNTLWEIANTYEAENSLIAARHSIEQASNVLEITDITRLVTGLHLTFGAVYLSGHNWAEAEHCFQTALASATPRLPGITRVAAYNSLATLYLRQNRLNEAMEAAQQAYKTLQLEADNIGMSSTLSTDGKFANPEAAIGEVLLTLTRVCEGQADTAKADEYFAQAITHLKTSNKPELLSSAYFSYGEMLLERGNSVQGAHYLKLAYEEKSRVS